MIVVCACGELHTGGSLDFNCMGIAGCVRCGWRGLPTLIGGRPVGRVRRCLATGFRVLIEDAERDTYCPACEAEPYVTEKVGRNQACPCGSGRKYKKCCLQKATA